MNSVKDISIAQLVLCVGLIAWLTPTVLAVPVQGHYVEDPTRCDPVPDIDLTHELGTGPAADPFPSDELIFADAKLTSQTVCAPDDGIANDWEIRMTNLSPFAWKDLHFVVDEGFTVGNADGMAEDLAAPGFTDAFRIDGTVTVTGMNDNLLFESGVVNEIFEPGESWTFLVTNFSASGPPTFDSIGFAVSSAGGPPSNASILANLVPEPGTAILLGLASLWMTRRRSKRA